MYSYKNGFIRSNKVIRVWYHYVSFTKKKGREEKKWKGKFRLLDLYIWTMSYYFKKQNVLTYHISWVILHSVPLSNWACIQLLKIFSQKKKKKKVNR